MSRTKAGVAITCVLVYAAWTPAGVHAQHHHKDKPESHAAVPESMRHEHKHIHEELERATKLSDATGSAARELAAVLAPHFERENQIGLPPLVVLPQLAQRKVPNDAARIVAMSDSLRAELPRMLQEHVRIRKAAEKLESAARGGGHADVEQLARTLQLHALTEEEVYYPAAIVVGDVIRALSRQPISGLMHSPTRNK